MKIPEQIQYIEIYYDGRCGMCCEFQEWLNRQARAFSVRFVPYQDEMAEVWFPELSQLEPEREMIVRTDRHEVFRGAEGWVLCLLSCEKYQGVARRMASPTLLPLTQKICQALAARRYTISKLLFARKDREVAAELHRLPTEECQGECQIPDGDKNKTENKPDRQ